MPIPLISPAAIAAASPRPTPPIAISLNSRAIKARLDQDLAKLAGREASQTPALQVAIVQGRQVVYNRAFGAASLTTRFPIGSITKMVTAVAIMQLVEAGRVNLDAKVSRYLEDAPYAGRITVRELLQHTSGLWNYGDYAFQMGLIGTATTPAAILAMASKYPLTSSPGTTWSYSNTGYVVLGLIVESVSGEPLEKYDREHIFLPAGMSQTTVGNPAASVPVATGYMSASGARAETYDPSWFFACGDIVSTAGDLARFDMALLDGTLLSAKTLAEMQTDAIPSDVGMWGLGLYIANWHGLQIIGHRGGVPGYEAENEMMPAAGLAWITLSDAFDFGTSQASRIVLQALFPSVTEPPVAVVAEDPAITKRFSVALGSLIRGEVDRSQYSDQANAAMTPALLSQTAAQLQPLGRIVRVAFIGSGKRGTLAIYKYAVTFENGQTLSWQFILDATNKISGISSI